MDQTDITDIVEVDNSVTPVVEALPSVGEIIEDKPLSAQEDTFALGVIEYGGNLRQAYEYAFGVGVPNPTAKGRALLNDPRIAARIRDITEAVHDSALISLGGHLVELADIRDLAKYQGQLKVALSAEEARGRVVGYYIGKEGTVKNRGTAPGDNPMVVIQINNHNDASI